MRVEVVRSPRRRKTVELKPTADGVIISIPANATKAEEERYIRTLLRKYERRQKSSDFDLEERAKALAARYDLGTPTSINWSDNQNSRWGSCTPDTGTIRISSNVSGFPHWVIDYVIVHELAHLSIYGHGQDFWDLVNRYPLTERARGFLIAKGLDGPSGEELPEGDETAVPSNENPSSPVIDLRDGEYQPKLLGF